MPRDGFIDTGGKDMIKVAVWGISGRMGNEVLRAMEETRDIKPVAGVDKEISPVSFRREKIPVFSPDVLTIPDVDIVIDFSGREGALCALSFCERNHLPIVSGSTALTDKELERFRTAGKDIPVFQSFNFSIGIAVLKRLVAIASGFLPDSRIEIEEIHHIHKKDAPSGTARMLAQVIEEKKKEQVPVHSLRLGEVPGDHRVIFGCGNEILSLSHRALSRRIFADGALRAVRFLAGKPPGYYTMDDLIGGQF